jgi:hypothetical protein
MGFGFNVCYPSWIDGAQYYEILTYDVNTLEEDGIYQILMTVYSDSTCQSVYPSENKQFQYSADCTSVNGFYQTGSLVTAPKTTFQGNGMAVQ